MKNVNKSFLTFIILFSLLFCNGGMTTYASQMSHRIGPMISPLDEVSGKTETKPSVQEDEPETWTVQQTVDEFGDVTDDSTTVVSAVVSGDFSNTATSGSDLTVMVYMNYGGDGTERYFYSNGQIYKETVVGNYPYFSFRLLEYNDIKATYTSYDDISIKTKIGDTIYEFNEVTSSAPNGDLTICDTWETTYNALYSGEDVRCIVYIGSSKYNFTLPADNFANKVKEAGLLTESVYLAETDDETLYNQAVDLIKNGQYVEATDILYTIKEYKDSSDLILIAALAEGYYNYNNDLWRPLFLISENTALADDELRNTLLGEWYELRYRNERYNEDGSYLYTSDGWQRLKDWGWSWSVEGDTLSIDYNSYVDTSYDEKRIDKYNVYPFKENAFVFYCTSSRNGSGYSLKFHNGPFSSEAHADLLAEIAATEAEKEKQKFLRLAVDYFDRDDYFLRHISEYAPLTGDQIKEVIVGKWKTKGSTKLGEVEYLADGKVAGSDSTWGVDGDSFVYYGKKETSRFTVYCVENVLVLLGEDGYPYFRWGEEGTKIMPDEIAKRQDQADTPQPIVYSDADTVWKVQEALNKAGYDCGAPDGDAGPNTHAAMNRYQQDHGLPITDDITDQLLSSLGIDQ